MILKFNPRIAGWIRSASSILLALIGISAAVWAVRLNLLEQSAMASGEFETEVIPTSDLELELPEITEVAPQLDIGRQYNLVTIFPDRPRMEVIPYTVQAGDSVFGIAAGYGLNPETILWGNYEVLNDDPHLLKPGQSLNVLPVDGTYYQWQEGDSIHDIADYFGVGSSDILDWPGNFLDPFDPQIEVGEWLIVPDGRRAFQQWFVPTIARGSAGVGSAYGPGGCSGDYSSGVIGSGGFIWPAGSRTISGNDYWSGHLAIDISAATGAPIFAADSGVVVFAGWAYGGYGNMVMIDHGNGWQTVYAHLSQVAVGCGQNVFQGSTIAFAGSTGNSTGPHLHFEVRHLGGFVNPWYILP